jgi:exonuclease III
VAGDFNVTLHQDDRVACPVPGVHIGASELLAVMGSAQLCDIWRDLNPAAMAFTHWSASTSSGKRLDRFLVSECFSPALTTAALPAATALSATSDILPSAPVSTDHLPVVCLAHPPLLPWLQRLHRGQAPRPGHRAG